MALEYVPHPWQRAAKRTALIVLPVLLQACALYPLEDGELAYYLDGSYYDSDYDTEHADHDAVYHSDRHSHAAHRKESRHGHADGRHHDRKSGRSHDGHKGRRKAGHDGRKDKPEGHARSGHGNRDRKAELTRGLRRQGIPVAARRAKSNPVRVDDSDWTTVQTPTGSVRIPTVIQGRDWTKTSKPRKKASAVPSRKHIPAYTKVPYKGPAVTSYGTGGKKRSSSADAVKPRKAARRSSKARRSPKGGGKANQPPSRVVDTSKWTTVRTPTGSVRVPSVIQGRDWTKASKPKREATASTGHETGRRNVRRSSGGLGASSYGIGSRASSSAAESVKPRKKASRSSKAQRKAASSRSAPAYTSKRTTVQTPMGSVRVPTVVQSRERTKIPKRSPKPVYSGKNSAKPSLPAYGFKSGVSRIRR